VQANAHLGGNADTLPTLDIAGSRGWSVEELPDRAAMESAPADTLNAAYGYHHPGCGLASWTAPRR
jgi:hypothetical protein